MTYLRLITLGLATSLLMCMGCDGSRTSAVHAHIVNESLNESSAVYPNDHIKSKSDSQSTRGLTLVTTDEVSELIDALSGARPITGLAPHDEVLIKLPQDVLDDLITIENQGSEYQDHDQTPDDEEGSHPVLTMDIVVDASVITSELTDELILQALTDDIEAGISHGEVITLNSGVVTAQVITELD